MLQPVKNLFRSARIRSSLRNLRAQIKRASIPDNAFFVIVMPGGLHLAKLAWDYIPDNVKRFVILNGTDAWETKWAKQHLPSDGICRTSRVLDHWDILDILFDEVDTNFGILDYDCYVFKGDCFDRIAAIDDETAIQAAFFRDNPTLKLQIPETFLLFFNTKLVNQIREKYGVKAIKYRWHTLPPDAQKALAGLGIGPDHLPEERKPYFDTLRAIMMLSIVNKTPYRYIEKLPTSPVPSDIAFHVGGVSDPRNTKGIWALRGSYFWRRVLETQDSEELRKHYYRIYGELPAGELLEERYATEDKIDPVFLEFCEKILKHEIGT